MCKRMSSIACFQVRSATAAGKPNDVVRTIAVNIHSSNIKVQVHGRPLILCNRTPSPSASAVHGHILLPKPDSSSVPKSLPPTPTRLLAALALGCNFCNAI
ncbi:hypothetical protein BCR44DRAFT_1058977 [Catenaria anguillulae PL171]|uniref:Uncharacterized protein n=1 Tax=Catenaria anguillulae PL171 TaxID=765915 RepID=A0A1Y2HSI0_9FUNG|nr:hypothetical protein BCR44DRAFT_1058977 [Catenaria anguillulae PL171]